MDRVENCDRKTVVTIHRDWGNAKIGAEALSLSEATSPNALLQHLDPAFDEEASHPRLKRLFDIVLATVLLVPLSVVMAVVALTLLVVQGRPILYRAERMQAPGRSFRQLKFRTMLLHDEDSGATGAHKHWRITPIGRFLRRSRIDEFPQLFNILRGEMSFVGPRPPLREYVERFPLKYRQVLRCRPGVTGLATLIYHRHEDRILARCGSAEATERAYYRRCLPAKLRIDEIYLHRSSLGLDLWILWNTARIVVSHRDERPRRRRSVRR
ncbi:sugar transferase [Paracoccus alkanivorans]|uniref:Sugar transferase n=1 Tax=Paracoccus alkanivorans TaxID=2116655 RepID=A0A3M0MAC8_9RHOB|nr:sugar transferase [Paracoccus alkanivorans]